MKELKFTTSKGEFILLDGKDTITERLTELLKEYDHYAVVKEMTEEQFGEVVNKYKLCGYENYNKQGYLYLKNATDSFMSLLNLLGVYLYNNPVENIIYNEDEIGEFEYNYQKWQEAESKTLYNPILLKKI